MQQTNFGLADVDGFNICIQVCGWLGFLPLYFGKIKLSKFIFHKTSVFPSLFWRCRPGWYFREEAINCSTSLFHGGTMINHIRGCEMIHSSTRPVCYISVGYVCNIHKNMTNLPFLCLECYRQRHQEHQR